jgi:hypothetical protein
MAASSGLDVDPFILHLRASLAEKAQAMLSSRDLIREKRSLQS